MRIKASLNTGTGTGKARLKLARNSLGKYPRHACRRLPRRRPKNHKQKHRSIQAPEPEKRVSSWLKTCSGSSQTRLPAPPPAAAEGRRRGRRWTACLGYFPSEFRAGLRHTFLVPVLVLSGASISTFTLLATTNELYGRKIGPMSSQELSSGES